MPFTNHLKKLRITKSIKQAEIADAIGLSQSEYSKIENNYIKLDLDLAIRIA